MTKTTDKTGNEIKPMENMFWLDGYKGECSSGFVSLSEECFDREWNKAIKKRAGDSLVLDEVIK